jgi:hypothetical protein
MQCIPWFALFPSGSSQFDTRLFFDALQRSYGDVSLRVWDRHPAILHRVFELLVAAGLIHFAPTITRVNALMMSILSTRDSSRVLSLNNTHTIHTCQSSLLGMIVHWNPDLDDYTALRPTDPLR